MLRNRVLGFSSLMLDWFSSHNWILRVPVAVPDMPSTKTHIPVNSHHPQQEIQFTKKSRNTKPDESPQKGKRSVRNCFFRIVFNAALS